MTDKPIGVVRAIDEAAEATLHVGSWPDDTTLSAERFERELEARGYCIAPLEPTEEIVRAIGATPFEAPDNREWQTYSARIYRDAIAARPRVEPLPKAPE